MIQRGDFETKIGQKSPLLNKEKEKQNKNDRGKKETTIRF